MHLNALSSEMKLISQRQYCLKSWLMMEKLCQPDLEEQRSKSYETASTSTRSLRPSKQVKIAEHKNLAKRRGFVERC